MLPKPITGRQEKLRIATTDPTQSFRGYLRKITNDAVCDAFQSRRRNAAPLSESIRMLSDIGARDDLVRRDFAPWPASIDHAGLDGVSVPIRIEPHDFSERGPDRAPGGTGN
jgi:hypothetical protein